MDNANGQAMSGSTNEPADAPLPRKPVSQALTSALGPGAEHAAAASNAGVTSLSPGAAQQPASDSRHGYPHGAPHHVHGSVLEGGDSPAVLAQPAAAASEKEGSRFEPDSRLSASRAASRAKDALSGAQEALSTRYRRASESTDDFVHDNPWKAIALAAVGGLIVGLLASR